MVEKRPHWRKVFKIFLRLKWKETIGNINWKLVFGIPLIAAIFTAVFLLSLLILGLPVYYLFHYRPSDCKTIIDSLMASGFIGFIVCAIAIGIIFYTIDFFKWVRINWKEAKKLAQE